MSLDKKEGCDEDPGTLSETETGLDCCDGMQPSNPEAEFDMKSNNCVDKNPPLIGPHLPSTPTQAVEVTSSVNSQNSEVEESSSEAKTGASTSCKDFDANGNMSTPQATQLMSLELEMETTPRTLYVGNLTPDMTESFLVVLFSQVGPVKNCRIVQESPPRDSYAFVEFETHEAAAATLAAMNKRSCFGQELRVNWASNGPGSTMRAEKTRAKSDLHHIFVGDLSPDTDTNHLLAAFKHFGEIAACRVVRDSITLKSRCYGFIAFVERSAAEAAIEGMNGYWLGNRSIRTNWASRNMTPLTSSASTTQKEYEVVFNQATDKNCTVYCGGVHSGLTEQLIQETFQTFGKIQEVRVFAEKGFGFVKFSSKVAAAQAIVAMNNGMINGYTVRCSWGKQYPDRGHISNWATARQHFGHGSTSSGTPVSAAPGGPIQYPPCFGGQPLYYWYPGGDPSGAGVASSSDQTHGFNPFLPGSGSVGYPSAYNHLGYQEHPNYLSTMTALQGIWGPGLAGGERGAPVTTISDPSTRPAEISFGRGRGRGTKRGRDSTAQDEARRGGRRSWRE